MTFKILRRKGKLKSKKMWHPDETAEKKRITLSLSTSYFLSLTLFFLFSSIYLSNQPSISPCPSERMNFWHLDTGDWAGIPCMAALYRRDTFPNCLPLTSFTCTQLTLLPEVSDRPWHFFFFHLSADHELQHLKMGMDSLLAANDEKVWIPSSHFSCQLFLLGSKEGKNCWKVDLMFDVFDVRS